MNKLYYGDNLGVLREMMAESVDLIYLDPPFNSDADYNVFFTSPKGQGKSYAQIEAFKDTWHWGDESEREFHDILHGKNTHVAEMMQALRSYRGENDMMAYLVMMTNRLLELHRVLKSTGSLYLHCDPTASHYLKVVLDGVFGKENYRSEISWRRSAAHNDAKQGRKIYGNVRDIIFFYTKSDEWTWNWLYSNYDEKYIEKNYRYTDANGRRYRLDNLTAAKPGGDVSYDFRGTKPYKGRYWAYSKENMQKFFDEGRLYFPKNDGTPSYIRYLDEMPGVSLQNDWGDIAPASGNEYLGYPTQKPLALLERIIGASSVEGDIVLDPFCGCGTAVHAAQKLGRNWIGVDITHLAISLIEKRLKDAFPGIKLDVQGTPKDFDSAADLARRDKYQFQWWACALVNAQPYQGHKKGADGGIDGLIWFADDKKAAKKIIVSVKGGENVSVTMVRDLAHVVEREKAAIGLFVTLALPTKLMLTEATRAGFYECTTNGKSYKKIQILTVSGLLSETERPDFPDLSSGITFKKAGREVRKSKQDTLF
jgi:adenine specific DNA methylase Mod